MRKVKQPKFSEFDMFCKKGKNRGKDVTITEDQYYDIISKDCSYCGSMNSSGYNGIDRIDSDLGYVDGNVQACCTRCNVMKMKMSEDEFISHIHKIVKFWKSRINC